MAKRHGGIGPGETEADPVAAAKSICLAFLTSRARTRSELTAKLAQRDIPPDVAERALDRLEAVGLIDDAAYAEAFVRSRRRDRGLGRAALRRELRDKGVDGEIIEATLAGIDDDSERDRAADLVRSRLDSAVFAGPQAARRRLMGLLARRGYSSSIAIAVVNDALRGFAEPADQLTEGDPTDPW